MGAWPLLFTRTLLIASVLVNLQLKGDALDRHMRRALAEGNPGYPVPRLMNQTQCEALLHQMV